MLEYKIVEKAAFTIMGKARKFKYDHSYEQIPKFWAEHMNDTSNQIVCGMYGVCLDCNDEGFEYVIADNYMPCQEIPEGYITRTIPAGFWAVFPCRGPLPKSLQDVNTKIWNEWLPNCKNYKLSGNYNIEMYTPPCENPEENYCEIWVPVEKN